jgi:hypothetical protein
MALSGMAFMLHDVRSWERCRNYLRLLSISHFDPERTWHHPSGGTPANCSDDWTPILRVILQALLTPCQNDSTSGVKTYPTPCSVWIMRGWFQSTSNLRLKRKI